MNIKISLCLFMLAAAPLCALGQSTSLQVVGQPGSYIADGTSVFFSTPTSQFSFSPLFNEDWTTGFQIDVQGSSLYSLSFAPPEGSIFNPSQRFSGATRYPFQTSTEAGMSISGEGRGCNELLGDFVISDVKYSPDKTSLESLAIDFTQKCEKTKPEVIGNLRFNSKIPSSLCPAVNLIESGKQFIFSKNRLLDKSNKLKNIGSVIKNSKVGTYKVGSLSFKPKLSPIKNGTSVLKIAVSNGKQTKNLSARDVSRAFIVLKGTHSGFYYENSSKIVYKLSAEVIGISLSIQFEEVGTSTFAFCTGKLS